MPRSNEADQTPGQRKLLGFLPVPTRSQVAEAKERCHIMKCRFVIVLSAVAVLAASGAGCSEDRRPPNDQPGEAVSEGGETADRAGALTAEALDTLRPRWQSQISGFEERLDRLRESLARTEDGELAAYVDTIATQLREARETFAGASADAPDPSLLAETMSARLTHLAGLIQAADDKLRARSAGGE